MHSARGLGDAPFPHCLDLGVDLIGFKTKSTKHAHGEDAGRVPLSVEHSTTMPSPMRSSRDLDGKLMRSKASSASWTRGSTITRGLSLVMKAPSTRLHLPAVADRSHPERAPPRSAGSGSMLIHRDLREEGRVLQGLEL